MKKQLNNTRFTMKNALLYSFSLICVDFPLTRRGCCKQQPGQSQARQFQLLFRHLLLKSDIKVITAGQTAKATKYKEKSLINICFDALKNLPATCAIILLLILTSPSFASIIPLAPYDEAFVSQNDFFLIFSIPQYESSLRRVKVFFDEEDISSHLRITGNTISFIPDQKFLQRPNLEGPHIVTIALYGPYQEKLDTYTLRFYLYKKKTITEKDKKAMVEKGKDLAGVTIHDFINHGTVYSGCNYASMQNVGKIDFIIDANGNGYKNKWYYNYNVSLDSDEDKKHQSLQRFRLATGWAHYLRLSAGDNWPSYNLLLLDGQRLRGIEVNVKTPKKSLNLDFTYGVGKRAIDPYTTTVNDSIAGTFRRHFFTGRLHFGSGEFFNLGLNFLKAKDDSTSITQLLSANTPKDNLVVGTDIRFNFWQRRISLYGNYAFSIFTNDTRSGPITQELANKIAGEEVDLPFLPKSIEKLIIFNQSTEPIPININSDKAINSTALKTTMAWNTGIRINLPYSNIRELFGFTYYMHGPKYKSLGNEYLPVNKTGFDINNELQFLQGKIMLKKGFGFYRDFYDEPENASNNFSLKLMANLIINSNVPTFSIFHIFNNKSVDEKNTGSFSNNDNNNFNHLGSTIQYTKKFNLSSQTFALTYHFSNNKLTKAINDSLRFSYQGNNILFSLNSNFDHIPLRTRATLFTFLTKGDDRITAFSPALGFSLDIIPTQLITQTDVTATYTNTKNDGKKGTREVNIKTNLSYDLTNHHSLFFQAGLDKKAKTGYLDRNMQLTYEYRY